MADASYLLASLASAIPLKYNTFNEYYNNSYRTIIAVAKFLSVNDIRPCTAPFKKNWFNVPSKLVSD